jgi:glutamate formiminotransferase
MESEHSLNGSLIECVPNVSEGRDQSRIEALEQAVSAVPGVAILHRTSDQDHNRTVITFAGSPDPVVDAAVALARRAAELIDLNNQKGVHPRLGALDVLPFVPLAGVTLEDCVRLAHRAGERIWGELGLPVYFYEAAALKPDRVRLEDIRRGEFEAISQEVLFDETRQPDLGGPFLHPTAGAVIVGARKILIAYNVNLRTKDLDLAKAIAAKIRTRGGGFPCVKAIGLRLASRGLVQVSMNLTDFEQTPPHVVFSEITRLAAAQGVEIEESELIGLMPRKAVELAAAGLLKLSSFDRGCVIENRLEQLGAKLGLAL